MEATSHLFGWMTSA